MFCPPLNVGKGGILTFGYPIGAAFTNPNGTPIQYFERARMELPSNPADTERVVLLGFLGEEALQAAQQPEIPATETTPDITLWYLQMPPSAGHTA